MSDEKFINDPDYQSFVEASNAMNEIVFDLIRAGAPIVGETGDFILTYPDGEESELAFWLDRQYVRETYEIIACLIAHLEAKHDYVGFICRNTDDGYWCFIKVADISDEPHARIFGAFSHTNRVLTGRGEGTATIKLEAFAKAWKSLHND
ncbi:MAG: hypothetical protein AAF267_17850 [Deinococcota bacterium]